MKRKMLNVKVVGCGGVGGCLLNVLSRYLAHSKEYTPNLTVVDGDSYTQGNSDRQEFTRLANKAEATGERLRRLYPSLLVTPVSSYLTSTNVGLVIKEGDVVFCCVDNHATRLLLSNHCETLRNVVLISGGNDEFTGNVQVYVRRDGVDVTRPITYLHREIEQPKDRNPGEATLGCEVAMETSPQYLVTNNFVAAFMFGALDQYLRGLFASDKAYDEVYFDGATSKARTVKR